jgi:adapter protein MecA 1/2
MILIITVDQAIDDDNLLYDGYIEMQVRVEGCEELLYEFKEFEDIIGLSKRLSIVDIFGGSLYTMNNRYYLLMDNVEQTNKEKAACILSEFGNPSILSPFVLAEYGKPVIEQFAVETILHFFK